MYSGGDSSGDGVNSRNPFNWQMTSQTSCNINSGGSIDWASLAQQWIQMKDSGAGLPDTPPPPMISANTKPIKNAKFDEQGEADMEVEKDDESQVLAFGRNTPPPPTNNINKPHWFPPQQDPAVYCAPQPNQWNPWPARVTLPPPALHVPITAGSLTPPVAKAATSTTPPLQNVAKSATEVAAMLPNKESLEPLPMDAAKRKILPAWIREGLEKMEREKLKQIEREQKDKDPQVAPSTVTGAGTPDSDINNKFKTMVKSSTTEMEGESSGNEEANDSEVADTVAPYNAIESNAAAIVPAAPAAGVSPERIIDSGKTYEERISDMMIAVRKTLTELLLEVTNEEISSIAHEAIRKRQAKASSAQIIRKSAIPSITGKLGLEAYADSDSENSSSDDDTTNGDSKRSDDENDSEEELKANIRICKRSFAKTIEDIEERIQASALREELLLKEHQKRDKKHPDDNYNRSPLHKTKGFDTEIGEPQPDKKSHSNGKRRKERTSRFSDNKDSRNRITTSYYQPQTSIGSRNLPSPTMPVSAISPSSNFASTKNKPTNSSVTMTVLPANEKRPSKNSNSSANKSSKHRAISSSSRHHQRNSDSSSSSSETSSSGTRSSHSRRSKQSSTAHHKRSSRERSKRSKRSNSYRSNRRRDSSDSNDDEHDKMRSSRHRSHKRGSGNGGSSSTYSRRHDRRRSDSRSSRSRTRSRSRSRSTTYSSRRGDRY